MDTKEIRAKLCAFRLANKMMPGNPATYVTDKLAKAAETVLDYIDDDRGDGPGACGEKVLLTTSE